jgi:hypothetical protein
MTNEKVPLFRESISRSFRPSAARAGIHNPCADDEVLRLMDSGFAASRRLPGMTPRQCHKTSNVVARTYCEAAPQREPSWSSEVGADSMRLK